MVGKNLKVFITIIIFLLFFITSTLLYIQKIIPTKRNIQYINSELRDEKLKSFPKEKTDPALITDATNLQTQLPVVLNMDSFILELGKAEVASGITIKNIIFGDNQNQKVGDSDVSASLPNFNQNSEEEKKKSNEDTTLPDGVKKEPIEIILKAPTYFHLYHFLGEIESLPRITSVDTIDFQGPAETSTSIQDNSNSIECNVTVSIFYDPGLESILKSALPKLEVPPPSNKEDPLVSRVQPEKSTSNEVDESLIQEDKTMDGAKNTKQFKVIKHVVQPGETLFTIAMKYYHSRDGEEIIQKYNHLTNTTVYFGTTLQIPLQTK